VKALFGENKVQAALQRLDRLTNDEVRVTLAQTLMVVQDMKAVMDGEHVFPVSVSYSELELASTMSDTAQEVMQETASETTGSEGRLFPYITDQEN
jgi:hypothetical protein